MFLLPTGKYKLKLPHKCTYILYSLYAGVNLRNN